MWRAAHGRTGAGAERHAGYSRRRARQAAHELLQRDRVREAIAAALGAQGMNRFTFERNLWDVVEDRAIPPQVRLRVMILCAEYLARRDALTMTEFFRSPNSVFVGTQADLGIAHLLVHLAESRPVSRMSPNLRAEPNIQKLRCQPVQRL